MRKEPLQKHANKTTQLLAALSIALANECYNDISCSIISRSEFPEVFNGPQFSFGSRRGSTLHPLQSLWSTICRCQVTSNRFLQCGEVCRRLRLFVDCFSTICTVVLDAVLEEASADSQSEAHSWKVLLCMTADIEHVKKTSETWQSLKSGIACHACMLRTSKSQS